MIDDEVAIPLVRRCVRETGNHDDSVPIEMQHTLAKLLIATPHLLESLRVRIMDALKALDPPHSIQKEFLNPIGGGTTVRGVVGIVGARAFQVDLEEVII